MSIKTTPFLHLPQWTGQEQPNFLAEINSAWAAIDKGYGDIKADAATAGAAASAAEASAADAVAKVNANASQIVTMQQEITQLEADFINAHYAEVLSGNLTVTDESVSSITYDIIYNEFLAYIHFVMVLKPNLSEATIGGVVGTFQEELPFIHKNISLHADIGVQTSSIQTGGSSALENCTNAISTLWKTDNSLNFASGALRFTTKTSGGFGIDMYACAPVFRMSNAKMSPPDNCIFCVDKK